MKTALVCAIFLGQFAFAAHGRDFPLFKRCRAASSPATEVSAGRTVCVRDRLPAPPPVAEMTTGCGPTVEGVFLRVATAPKPLQMVNPAAPPEYGSAGSLVTYTDDYLNRDSNPNQRRWQADGVRFLTFRTFW